MGGEEKKARVTPHSGTFVAHEESRAHSDEPVKDEYSGKIWPDRRGGGPGQRWQADQAHKLGC